ncbi:MAG: serine/threonine protein kinase [Myxococcales bacterium]|nr:serine/threonine protein kinase [Myxococcales bacterium]
MKLIPAEVLPTPAMADRALRELKQLAKVTSDRIVRVVDQGRLPDGRLYVVTEKVDGVTLEELIGREGPLPLERAKAIVLQVGEALTEAQKVGVIHRDVAPRNIMVGPGDRVKVADFGLAEPVTDKVFGAPGFLSPEQAEGKPVDQRSNIYSLGAVYYFALTGTTPFVGDANNLMRQHLSAAPPPPSTRRPGLGSDVDRVILKALEKSGGRRHLTLRQLLTEVAATHAQQVRAGSEAKTMMGEAPSLPTAQPQRPAQPAQTIMGMASPLAAMGPPGPKTSPSVPAREAPATQPTMPVAPATTPIMEAVTAPSMPAPSRPAPSMPAPSAAPPSTAAPAPQAPAPRAPAPQAPAPQAAPQASAPQAPAPQAPSLLTPPPPSVTQIGPPMSRPPAAMPGTPQHLSPQAPTMMAEAPRAAAPPATAAPVPAKGNNTGKKGAFRETAWFKRGELEEEMAKAQAAVGENALKSGTTGQHLPVDESQVDLSAHDRERLSLKTGATQAMPIIKAPAVQALPGERMDEAEMLAEINPSKRYFLIAGAIVLAIVIGLVLYFTTRPASHAEAPPADKPAPVAAAPPASGTTAPSSPAPAPVPPTPPTPSPTPKTPAAAIVSPSVYGAAVEKLEGQPSPDKKELKRLDKLIGIEMKVAHKKKEKALETADRDLLARVKKLEKK